MVVLLSLELSQGESRGRHARHYTHSSTTTRARVNGDVRHSIVHSPNGRSVNVVGIYLLSRGGTRRYACRVERKLKIKAYRNFKEKEG